MGVPLSRFGLQTQPLCQVVLLNDNDHGVAHVVEMLEHLFGHSPEQARQLARQVQKNGRAVVDTTPWKRAMLKRDQILAFGRDPSRPHCQGSMAALIEPGFPMSPPAEPT